MSALAVAIYKVPDFYLIISVKIRSGAKCRFKTLPQTLKLIIIRRVDKRNNCFCGVIYLVCATSSKIVNVDARWKNSFVFYGKVY